MQQYFTILKTRYDQSTFQKFAHELLNDIEVGRQDLQIDSPFKDHIASLSFLGSYQDPQGKNLHILDVTLKTQIKLEQARTMQRNLIARYLKDHWLDGALVAFHSDNTSSWRLSFVKVEYKYDEKGKTKEEITPAKRYSFLVGEGEPVHTAQAQLSKIYEQTVTNPNLGQLEEAFGVEKVTREFFEKYRELFESVVVELKSNHTFQNEVVKNNIDTESFAKKLLGQIVFLYFLQKKGWLGVPKGKSWGEGDKMFLRNIYNQAVDNNKNFFNNYLEVLFYDTLNNPRNDKVDRNYSDFFGSKIPFLNGGLFEPQYEWKTSLMYLDNKLFDKVLGVFDTYNFTVKEDEPLEKEVAVDPEMLGKVFENLLEENLRKGKGTYYTPREIVHYMCEESLINHIATEVGLTSDDVRSKYFPAYNVIGDEKFEARDVSVSEKIIESLENIKVVDPACGSGAFLVGMLQQITQLRNELETRSKLLGRRDTTSTEYVIKKQTIQNCIYGVDIDPGAIEIAKLRLWLSLVVDYDLEQIEPLPNLDYKIMQGNSLLEELVLGDTSIKLYDTALIQKAIGSKRMKNLFDVETQISLFDGENDKVLKTMKALQLKYFSTSDGESKKKIKDQIEKIEHELIEVSVKVELDQLQSQKINIKTIPGIGLAPNDVKKLEKITSKESQIFAVLNELEKTGTKPFFLWHLHFADVFEEKGGFDIVIANPPYIDSESMVKDAQGVFREYLARTYKMTRGNWDIYIAFFELGLNILNEQGVLIFITPDKWISKPFGDELRKKTINNIYSILRAGREVFDAAKVDSIVTLFNKTLSSKLMVLDFKNFEVIFKNKIDKNTLKSPYALDFLFSDYLAFLLKIESAPSKLSDLGNCEGACATSDAYKLKPLVKNALSGFDRKNQLKIINTGTISKYFSRWGNQEMTYLGHKYLNPVVNREEFFELFKNSYATKSIQPKIIIKGLNLLDACLDLDGDVIPGKSTLIITSEDINKLKPILSIVNSKLAFFYIKERYPASSYNQGTTFTKDMLNNLPLPKFADEEQQLIKNIVDKILIITKGDGYLTNSEEQAEVKKYRTQIDQIIYKLYGLTEEEVSIVEGSHD